MAITPTWTDNVPVIASAALARGSVARGTLDLRSKFAAYLFIRIGRTGTAVLSNGVVALVRRVLNGDVIAHPGNVWIATTAIAAANESTVATDAAAGATALVLASGTGFAAGDYALIAEGTAREEWARVAGVNTNTLTLDRGLRFAHTAAQADPVANKAECFDPVWVPGGSMIEVVIDYADDGSGDSVRVEALAQTYDSDLV